MKKVNLDDERLFSAIVGSGCSYTYGWYGDFVPDWENLTVRVLIENGNGNGYEGANLSVASLRRTIHTILDDRPQFTTPVQNTDWSDPECDSEVDADVADTVLQYAVLGEVIYG